MREKEKKSRKFAKQLRKNLTNAEVILWSELKSGQMDDFKFRRQHPVGPFIADFANMKTKLIIEIDGNTHSEDHEIKYDEKRTKFLEREGWIVIRFWNTDIYENLDGVLDTIYRHLTE
jgi:very-short-patch-repair endonuclease